MSSVVDEVSSGPKPALGFLASPAARSLIGGLAAAAAWLAVAALITYWPDKPDSDWDYTDDLAALCGALAIALALAVFSGVWFAGLQRARRLAPWLVALALFLAAWEAVTAKLGWLPLPFFPPPQAILEVVIDDRARQIVIVESDREHPARACIMNQDRRNLVKIGFMRLHVFF